MKKVPRYGPCCDARDVSVKLSRNDEGVWIVIEAGEWSGRRLLSMADVIALRDVVIREESAAVTVYG